MSVSVLKPFPGEQTTLVDFKRRCDQTSASLRTDASNPFRQEAADTVDLSAQNTLQALAKYSGPTEEGNTPTLRMVAGRVQTAANGARHGAIAGAVATIGGLGGATLLAACLEPATWAAGGCLLAGGALAVGLAGLVTTVVQGLRSDTLHHLLQTVMRCGAQEAPPASSQSSGASASNSAPAAPAAPTPTAEPASATAPPSAAPASAQGVPPTGTPPVTEPPATGAATAQPVVGEPAQTTTA